MLAMVGLLIFDDRVEIWLYFLWDLVIFDDRGEIWFYVMAIVRVCYIAAGWYAAVGYGYML